MWSLIVILCVTVYAAGDPVNLSSIPRLDGRIVGGEPADITDYPHQVSLQYIGSHICGGSIIGINTVLTAAHCVDPATPTRYSILAGSTDRGSLTGQRRVVSSVRIHNKYSDKTVDYDVAVLTVSSDFVFSNSVKIIELQEESVAAGKAATVTGWGVTVENGTTVPRILNKVNVNVISYSDCNKKYLNGLTSRMICAGVTAGGKDACQGDSGGPLISGGKQIGIVSWGFGCARPEYPGVYSNVAELRNWIINSGTRTPPVNLFMCVLITILTVYQFSKSL